MALFTDACAPVEAFLSGTRRQEAAAARSLPALRRAMQSHALAPVVPDLERRTRDEGFHVLHDWDGRAGRVTAGTIPVDVLDYAAARLAPGTSRETAAAILIDYYFLHVLALLAMRIWDEGDPDANIDRVDGLLDLLQGPRGSGHWFVDNAATLLLLATAHYEADEGGYHALLERVRALNADHRASVALDHAGSLGCHLRFGFEATYGRDIVLMRCDNGADYPWVSFALATLADEYAARPDPRTAEGILNALSADALAFARLPEFSERFDALRAPLLETFETLRPGEHGYSPLSLFFNFSHNVVKGTVIDAVLTGEPWDVTLNDLLTALPPEPPGGPRHSLATRLMAYARAQPDPIRGRLTPAIVYDPQAGRRAFGLTLRTLAGLS
jgi:hypothetical protein